MVTSPSVQQGAIDTAGAIKRKDESLPKEALEKTDRTAVVANTDQQKVDVYKVNLSPKILRSVGYMVHTENIQAPGIATFDFYKRVDESGFYVGVGTTYDIDKKKATVGLKLMW